MSNDTDDEEATGKVLLDPEEASELGDLLADADIDTRKLQDEDPGQGELFEWSKELRRRVRDVQDEE